MSIMQKQAAFEANQQQMVQAVQQETAASQQVQQQYNSNSGAAGFYTFQSPYRPPKYDPPPNPQIKWMMGSDGQLMPF